VLGPAALAPFLRPRRSPYVLPLVEFSSSATARLAPGSVFIPEGSLEETVDLPVGQECGQVVLTATTSDHRAATITFLIARTPVLSAISPAQVQACTPFRLQLDGLCLGDVPSQVSVSLSAGETIIPGTIVGMQSNTRIVAEFPALEPGYYFASITACGLTGFADEPTLVSIGSPTLRKSSQKYDTSCRARPIPPTSANFRPSGSALWR